MYVLLEHNKNCQLPTQELGGVLATLLCVSSVEQIPYKNGGATKLWYQNIYLLQCFGIQATESQFNLAWTMKEIYLRKFYLK
jgi:hypothetical protein